MFGSSGKGSAALKSNPIFIGGDGRSGTTLLSVMLDSHPQLAVGPELHFNGPPDLGPDLLRCLELLEANDPRAFGKGLKQNPELKRGVQFAKRCHRFGVEFGELSELVRSLMAERRTRLETLSERAVLIDALGELVRTRAGKDRWGIKIMREIRNVAGYAREWPRAQFIHLVRDGRDVAASQMTEHGSWGYDDIEKAARGWVDLIDRARAAAASHPVLEVRYEDLVLEPEPTLRRVLAFLEVAWSDAPLKHSEADHALFKNPYNHPSLEAVIRPVNATAVGRYRRDLAAEQIAAFDAIAGAHLRDLGYAVES